MEKGLFVLGVLILANVAVAAPPSFGDVDRDGSKLIDRQEAERHPAINRRFHDIDTNDDGYIDRVEYIRNAPTNG